MENGNKIPDRLYRYRDSSIRTLEMMVSDHHHYADPSNFNDPMDSRPSLDVDLDNNELEKICRILVEKRTAEEMHAAAKTMRAEGPKAIHHIEQNSRGRAASLIAEIAYRALDPDYDVEDHKRHLLRHRIEEELLRQYEKGIVCFAEWADCSLMWSHYGDQHRGVCIGYSVPSMAAGDIHKVEYRGGRLVRASWVAAMLDGDDAAQREVDKAVLLRKAENWSYEREWRLIGRRGLQDSLLELEEVVFGLKCTAVTKYIAMKALEGRERSVKFYEMREEFGTFNLRRCALSYDDELFRHFPVRHLSIFEMFESVSISAE